MQDKPRKNHASQKDIMSTPLRKRRKVRTSKERHIRKPSPPQSQPFSSIERSKLSLRHTLARFLWHHRGLLCILKQATGSTRYPHFSKTSTRRLQPILYSRVFYKLIPHASSLHKARQNISTPSCTCPIPVAQVTDVYKKDADLCVDSPPTLQFAMR